MSSEGVLKIREVFRECKKQERQTKRLAEFNRFRKTLGEENNLSDRVITPGEIRAIAKRLKQKGNTTIAKDLALLKYGLIQSNDNIVAFLTVPGALHSLIREMTAINSELVLPASDCCCNLTLGEPKACMQVAKAATPYLITYLHGLNYGLMNISLWILGNLAASDIKVWHILRSQGLLPRLLIILEIPDLRENSTYALLHYVHTGLYELTIDEVMNITNSVLKMNVVTDDIYWTLHLLTCIKGPAQLFFRTSEIVTKCVELLYQLPINSQHVKTITALLRIIGNLVTEESGDVALKLLNSEWNEVDVIGYKLWNSDYPHLVSEFCWMVGNIINHPSAAVQKVLDLRKNEIFENVFDRVYRQP